MPRVSHVCLLWCMLAAVAAPAAHAATYTLDPVHGADGGPGTPGAPWRTLRQVKAAAQPGDTINIVGGSYTNQQVIAQEGVPAWTEDDAHGTAGHPITLQAAPGATVTIDGGGANFFQYFEPSGGTAPVTDRYVIIKDLHFHNYAGAVIHVAYARSVAVIHCTFEGSGSNGVSLGSWHTSQVLFLDNHIEHVGSHGIYMSEGSDSSVVSGNTVVGVGDNGIGPGGAYGLHYWGHDGAAPTTRSIVRRNIVAGAMSANITISGTAYRDIYVYHNTLVNDQDHVASNGLFTTHHGGSYTHLVLINNILAGYAGTGALYSDPGQGYTALRLDYNLVAPEGGAPAYAWDGGNSAPAGAEQHSRSGNPQFVDAGSHNVALQAGSPAIDGGTPLTTARSAGSGTLLPVEDAGYFYDGYGLVPGDMIQVGTQAPVQVRRVDYASNTLTVSQPLTWKAGDGVTQPFQGRAPDMGAIESGGGGQATPVAARPNPPPTVHPVDAIPDPSVPQPTHLRLLLPAAVAGPKEQP